MAGMLDFWPLFYSIPTIFFKKSPTFTLKENSNYLMFQI